jgi:hypothetical protein
MASSIPFTLKEAQQDLASGAVLYRICVSAATAGPAIRYKTATHRPDSPSRIPDFRGEPPSKTPGKVIEHACLHEL